MSLSNSWILTLLLSRIPVGNEFDFIICTLFPDFIYVGHAPLFINSIVPLYKSIIAISSVANISLFLFSRLAFIKSSDVFLSNPDNNKFSNNSKALSFVNFLTLTVL